ncbi:MAG: hypothetical protein K5905_16770 [Roseibium sp.]|uniref:hypothetical protein n=1 Tax=Roseibium sp. TaxID=1936156 RepID=UPI00262CC4DC|nr:hypothetical protein [Roseibium sp.]MCV0427117.1 hypothetical protein [Roseibium sp.]
MKNLRDMIEAGGIQLVLKGCADKSRSHRTVYPNHRPDPFRVRMAMDCLLDSFAQVTQLNQRPLASVF